MKLHRLLPLAAVILALALGSVNSLGFAAISKHDSEFESLVQDYLKARRAEWRPVAMISLEKIRAGVFANPGSNQYQERIRTIDGLFDSYRTPADREAISDLALAIQQHWEVQWGAQLRRTQSIRVHAGTEIGFATGAIALGASLGASLILKSQAVPMYFRLIRHLMPLAGTLAGAHGTDAFNQSGLLIRQIPRAPAQLMHLGLEIDDFHYDDYAIYRDLVSISAGTAAMSMTLEAANALNLASTPLKVHPAVLISSIVLGFAVQEGVIAGIHAYQLNHLQAQVLSAVEEFDRAVISRNETSLIQASDALVKASTILATFLNEPTGGLGNVLIHQAQASEPEYEADFIRTYLRNNGVNAGSDLKKETQAQARRYSASFNRWLQSPANAMAIRSHAGDKKVLFREFLSRFDQSQDKRLAQELRSGMLGKTSTRLLLQSAALLRSTRTPVTHSFADSLKSQAIRTMELFTFPAEAGGKP